MKIKDIINKSKLDKKTARNILSKVLDINNTSIILNQDQTVNFKSYLKYKNIENRIIQGTPIQYALKKAEFLGLIFYINKHVLIPRPETEFLVQEVDKLIKEKLKNEIKIIEIGTGSGVIAISLKRINQSYQLLATDISKKALKVAHKNQRKLNTDIKFIRTDISSNINEKFDVLVSNPPYIPNNSTEVEAQVNKYEPHLALYGGDDGLYFYKRILKETKSILNIPNIIAFEIGYNQAQKISDYAKTIYKPAEIIIKKDLNNYERYIFIINK